MTHIVAPPPAASPLDDALKLVKSGDPVVFDRDGQPLAALISIADLEILQAAAKSVAAQNGEASSASPQAPAPELDQPAERKSKEESDEEPDDYSDDNFPPYQHPPLKIVGTANVRYTMIGRGKPRRIIFNDDDDEE